jgi:hypothetical protein
MVNTMPFFVWLRRYVVVSSIILLGGFAWASWNFYQSYQSIASIQGGAWARYVLWGFTIRLSIDVLFVLLLLLPWWRFGPIARSIGITVFLVAGVSATWQSLWAILHGGGRLIFPVIITAFAAHSLWLFRALVSKRHDA